MPWTAIDWKSLPQVEGETYTQKDVLIDGTSYQKCSFNQCRLIYRGGPSRLWRCYIGPGCTFQFEDAAAYTLQILQELGWQIAPPGHVDRL